MEYFNISMVRPQHNKLYPAYHLNITAYIEIAAVAWFVLVFPQDQDGEYYGDRNKKYTLSL
ncbi:hypothetical protein PITCH_A80028 [uncultured Desulfobacterium sp.]|uniref:Uncharacterized protein n=1 Tax=uncultured Desulfobacterium sp. TaxID=201089 RepID=A0A445N2W6_9BACT|nr:hypothetical protein PITCH_A80028 [uncultured Desulfobacterium sp.]